MRSLQGSGIGSNQADKVIAVGRVGAVKRAEAGVHEDDDGRQNGKAARHDFQILLSFSGQQRPDGEWVLLDACAAR
jgi:hypothetical protein